MTQIRWYIEPIENHMAKIKSLFSLNYNHRHADNYLKYPLFAETKFARMGYNLDNMIYYSAGIERPEYNGSIRIMSRHTRDRNFNFGGVSADLARGIETLDQSTQYALDLGYKDIWISREENSKILDYFKINSKFTWNVTCEDIPRGYSSQYVLRLA
jgi:hypothetical protein